MPDLFPKLFPPVPPEGPDLEAPPGKVTIVICCLCVAVALPTWFGPGELGFRLLAWGAKENDAIAAGEWWRLLSAAFLHGDLSHLIFNLYALFIFGSLVEHAYGPMRFIVIYVLAAVSGSLASYHASHNMSVGASGAIFGLMGAALLAGWRGHAHLRPLLRGRAAWGIAGWGAYSLLRGLADPNIDNAAHVGGLVGGAAVAVVLPGGRIAAALAAAASAVLLWTGSRVADSAGMVPAYAAFTRGIATYSSDNPGGAEAAFTEALAYPPARLWRAQIRITGGQYAEALADLDTLLTARVRAEVLTEAQLSRAIALLELGRPADALASTVLVSQSCDSLYRAGALLARGRALHALRRLDGALQAWDSAVASPDSVVAYDASFRRGLLLDSLGRRAEAVTAYRTAGGRVEDAAAWLKAFWSLHAMRQHRQAAEVLDTALAVAQRVVAHTHEADRRALELLASALDASGEEAEARLVQRKARALAAPRRRAECLLWRFCSGLWVWHCPGRC